AMPRDDVERRVVDLGAPDPAGEFRDELEVALDVLERGDGREEVARRGEAVRADEAEVGEAEERAVVLADVAARGAVGELDAELDPALDDGDLARLDLDLP